jgi:hypothetical protein
MSPPADQHQQDMPGIDEVIAAALRSLLPIKAAVLPADAISKGQALTKS